MKVFCAALCAALALCAGCGRPSTPAPAAPETAGDVSVAAPDDTDPGPMVMRGIDLYMHRKTAPEGVAGMPELWVRAEQFSIQDARAYHFENARAVIYGAADHEEIVIEAERGSFEQDRRALLEGDIRLTAGTLRMHLRDIEWARPEADTLGMAHSDSPVIIDDPELQLNATGLRLFPDTQTFELDNVSGVLRFDATFM